MTTRTRAILADPVDGRESGGVHPPKLPRALHGFGDAPGPARRVYPGPLGELVHRELTTYAELGFRFGDGLIQDLTVVVAIWRATQSGPLPTGAEPYYQRRIGRVITGSVQERQDTAGNAPS